MKIPMVLARNKGGEISEIQKSIPFWIWHSMMYMILCKKKKSRYIYCQQYDDILCWQISLFKRLCENAERFVPKKVKYLILRNAKIKWQNGQLTKFSGHPDFDLQYHEGP